MKFRAGDIPWNKGKSVPTTGKNHPMWKGGKGLTTQGYVTINVSAGKRVLEHRYVMEQHLKRKLTRSEHVHHRNGVKTDNRIENLELISWHEHGREHASRQWLPGGSLRKRYE
jgi:hypothetical protein